MSGYDFKKNCILLSENCFTFTNSVDTDEMQHHAAFHLGLNCLEKVSQIKRVNDLKFLIHS